jgi:hypothetical protein
MRHPCVLLAVLLVLPPSVAAQNDDSTKAVKLSQPERLFRSRDILTLTLRAPLKTLFKDRDTVEVVPVPGELSVAGEAKPLPVTLETRGHFRLRRTTCAFPPIKVRFDKEAAKGTVFSSQGSLKLGTHCQSGTAYDQNVLLEEAIYRAYNLLTNYSHRTRLAKINYVDTDDTTKSVTRFGYFLEDDSEMAKRNGGKVIIQQGGNFTDMEPGLLDLVGVFQYMVGNTDWSIWGVHNIRLVEVPDMGGFYMPVAYDFDFSGLVNAPYAIPDERLPIKRVRQRLYRGACRKIEEIEPTLAFYRAKRDSIETIFTSIEGLEPKRAKDVKEYLGEFFDEIKDAKSFKAVLEYPCSRER